LDWLKTFDLEKLRPYPVWIVINCLMFCVCSAAVQAATHIVKAQCCGGAALSSLAELVFAAACVRTGIDYAAGAGFLFPGARRS
jgi:hypothetical protein